MTKLVFLDTETTGLDPDLHDLWEIAAIVREDGQPDKEYLWYLRPNLGKADPMAMNINRFYEREPTDGMYENPFTFAGAFSRLTRGAHLVGAVISFDEERLRRLIKSLGHCPMWHYHLVDVEALVAGRLQIRPPWKSQDLWEKLGLKKDNYDLHTALGDARLARDIYDRVMKQGVQRP